MGLLTPVALIRVSDCSAASVRKWVVDISAVRHRHAAECFLLVSLCWNVAVLYQWSQFETEKEVGNEWPKEKKIHMKKPHDLKISASYVETSYVP